MKAKAKSSHKASVVRKLGIVGGLGSLAGGDLFYKLVKSRAVLEDQGRYHFLFEQHPFKDVLLPLDQGASMTSRKFYVFQVCKSFEDSGFDAVMLPCFASHTFRAEIEEELGIPVLDMMAALTRHVSHTVPPKTTLGVIASDFVRHCGLFERHFGKDFQIVYPDADAQAGLMEAMYGLNGIKDGHLEGVPLEAVYQACLSLQAQGATVILPGMTELSLVCADLQRRGITVLDVNEIYADFATLDQQPRRPPSSWASWAALGQPPRWTSWPRWWPIPRRERTRTTSRWWSSKTRRYRIGRPTCCAMKPTRRWRCMPPANVSKVLAPMPLRFPATLPMPSSSGSRRT